jgi:hypothetical protein
VFIRDQLENFPEIVQAANTGCRLCLNDTNQEARVTKQHPPRISRGDETKANCTLLAYQHRKQDSHTSCPSLLSTDVQLMNASNDLWCYYLSYYPEPH